MKTGPGPLNVSGRPSYHIRDMVPKIEVEEKEQEILAKEETIQVSTCNNKEYMYC